MNYKINYFKVQLGGMDRADINTEVVSILEKTLDTNNLGQNNCGIIPYLDYILKCGGRSDALTMNDSIREYFPQYYLWPDGKFIKEINTKPFYIMEKLDGDLTSYIIEQSYIRAYDSLEGGPTYEVKAFKLYYETLPKTKIIGLLGMHPIKYLSKEGNIIIDRIKNDVYPYIIDILNTLQPKIIELHHNLIKRNHKYGDLKLDNIGYKILENEDIKLYFIDIESGLSQIKQDYYISQSVKVLNHTDTNNKYEIVSLSEDNKKANLKAYSYFVSDDLMLGDKKDQNSKPLVIENIDIDLLDDFFRAKSQERINQDFKNFLNSHGLITYLQNYGILGQYNLNAIYNLEPIKEKFNLDDIESAIEKITIKYGTGIATGIGIDRKYNILTKGKYRCNGHNDFFCIQICTVYLRLVRFDDYGRYQSNTRYNNYFTPIDELFDNLESLLSRLEEIYPN